MAHELHRGAVNNVVGRWEKASKSMVLCTWTIFWEIMKVVVNGSRSNPPKFFTAYDVPGINPGLYITNLILTTIHWVRHLLFPFYSWNRLRDTKDNYLAHGHLANKRQSWDRHQPLALTTMLLSLLSRTFLGSNMYKDTAAGKIPHVIARDTETQGETKL